MGNAESAGEAENAVSRSPAALHHRGLAETPMILERPFGGLCSAVFQTGSLQVDTFADFRLHVCDGLYLIIYLFGSNYSSI